MTGKSLAKNNNLRSSPVLAATTHCLLRGRVSHFPPEFHLRSEKKIKSEFCRILAAESNFHNFSFPPDIVPFHSVFTDLEMRA